MQQELQQEHINFPSQRAKQFESAVADLLYIVGNTTDQGKKVDYDDAIAEVMYLKMLKSTNAFMSTNEWKQKAFKIASKYFPNQITDLRNTPAAAIAEIQEMFATITGGSLNRPGREVSPLPGLNHLGTQISDDIIIKAGVQDWLDDATNWAIGGIRGGRHADNDMQRLEAMFGSEKVPKALKEQAEKLHTLADNSAKVRNNILARDIPVNKALLKLPLSLTDIQQMGEKAFIALVSNGKYKIGDGKSGEVILPELAARYWKSLVDENAIPDDDFSILTMKGIFAEDADSHWKYLKATGARSFTDNLMGNVAALGIKEASARALGNTPADFIKDLIADDITGLMGKVFNTDGFGRKLQNSLDRATGHADAIAFQPKAIQAVYGTFSVAKTVGHALVLKDAALSVFADLPLRSPINAAFRDTTQTGQIIRDFVGQLNNIFSSTKTNKGEALAVDQLAEIVWQDVVGSGQFLDANRATHRATRFSQKFANAFHTVSGFRAANEGSQVRANGEFLIKMRNAIERSKGNWDDLPERLQLFLNDNYLIDKFAFNDIASHANLKKTGIDIFDFDKIPDYTRQRLQIGMRQNLHQSTGRANPFQVGSSPLGGVLTAQRGTFEREFIDLTLPFFSPLVNQVAMLKGIGKNISRMPDGERTAAYAKLVTMASAFYIAYGVARVALSDKANGRRTQWGESETNAKILMYGAIPMAGFFYGGGFGGVHGFQGSDIAIGQIYDTVVLGYDVSKGDSPSGRETAEYLHKKVPSMYKVGYEMLKSINN